MNQLWFNLRKVSGLVVGSFAHSLGPFGRWGEGLYGWFSLGHGLALVTAGLPPKRFSERRWQWADRMEKAYFSESVGWQAPGLATLCSPHPRSPLPF